MAAMPSTISRVRAFIALGRSRVIQPTCSFVSNETLTTCLLDVIRLGSSLGGHRLDSASPFKGGGGGSAKAVSAQQEVGQRGDENERAEHVPQEHEGQQDPHVGLELD